MRGPASEDGLQAHRLPWTGGTCSLWPAGPGASFSPEQAGRQVEPYLVCAPTQCKRTSAPAHVSKHPAQPMFTHQHTPASETSAHRRQETLAAALPTCVCTPRRTLSPPPAPLSPSAPVALTRMCPLLPLHLCRPLASMNWMASSTRLLSNLTKCKRPAGIACAGHTQTQAHGCIGLATPPQPALPEIPPLAAASRAYHTTQARTGVNRVFPAQTKEASKGEQGRKAR